MAPAVAQEISQGELDATWKQLAAVPRAQLEQAMARLQELGAAAFKQKDYKKAYEHYNQVVTGAEYLQQTGPEPDDTKAVMHALSNRSACKLGLGDAAGAFKDASACVRYDPKWQKGWYRFGRALYEQKRFAEAEAAFAEGVQIDVENGEMLRWRAKCRKQMEAQRVESMRRRRHVTDYSKFAAAEAEADVPDEEARGPGGIETPALLRPSRRRSHTAFETTSPRRRVARDVVRSRRSPRKIRVAAAASPRLAPTECLRRRVAATRLRGIATSRPRRRRDSSSEAPRGKKYAKTVVLKPSKAALTTGAPTSSKTSDCFDVSS